MGNDNKEHLEQNMGERIDSAFISTNKRITELIGVVMDLKTNVWDVDRSNASLIQGYAGVKDELSYYKAYTKSLQTQVKELADKIEQHTETIKAYDETIKQLKNAVNELRLR